MTKPRFLKWFIAITLSIILLDQILKQLILRTQPEWHSPLLTIHLITNTGAGFGILQNQTWILTILSFIVACTLIWLYKDAPKEWSIQILLALFLGGVIGNLIDRAMRGFVIDFIDFGWWPAFNLADASITIAVMGMIFYYWKK